MTGRFLFCVWPYPGHLHPCIALAGRLRAQGHHIAFYTGASGCGAVTGEGYEFLGFESLARYLEALVPDSGPMLYHALNERYTTIAETTPWGKLRRVRQLFLEMTAGSLGAQWDDLRRIVKDWRPDVVITDPMLWAPIVLLHEGAGIPVVPFSFYAGCLVPGRRMANAGLGLPPARDWSGAFRNDAANWIMRMVTAPVRQLVNEIRRREKLTPISDSVLHHSGRMPLYLVASSPEYDYARGDLAARVEYAGPCLWEPAGNGVDADSSAPIVYVSEGTAQLGGAFLIRPAIEALADEKVQVVVTTGRHRTPESLRIQRPPENVRLFQWVSHRQLMPRTRVVVTSGGSNTVRQALACGVPLLVVPLEWDQLENAQRVAHCGAGIRISRSRCTPGELRNAIRALLHEAHYRENAQRIGESFRRLEQSSRAIDRLEALAYG